MIPRESTIFGFNSACFVGLLNSLHSLPFHGLHSISPASFYRLWNFIPRLFHGRDDDPSGSNHEPSHYDYDHSYDGGFRANLPFFFEPADKSWRALLDLFGNMWRAPRPPQQWTLDLCFCCSAESI